MNSNNTPPKYKMVALDLDGTLLNPNHQLTDETVNYLRYLHSKGFIISIATGRVATCTFEHIRRLNLPQRYCHSIVGTDELSSHHHLKCGGIGIPMVCSNGAHGLRALVRKEKEIEEDDYIPNEPEFKSQTSKIHGLEYEMMIRLYGEGWKVSFSDIFHEVVPQTVAETVIDIATTLGLLVQYYTDHDIYENSSKESHRQWVQWSYELTGYEQIHCDDGFQCALQQKLPSKLLIVLGSLNIDHVIDLLRSKVGDDANIVVGSPPMFVEILNKEVSKGHGLKRISKSLGVELQEVIAFGDGDNDIEFIEMAGRGIAMLNAQDNVKAVADEVCEWSNAEDGVILKLKQMENDGKLYFSLN